MTVLKVITTPDKSLRQKSRHSEASEIKSPEVQKIVQNIKDTLKAGQYGVGMSAVQIGKPLALAVVMIRPTPTRPNLKKTSRTF